LAIGGGVGAPYLNLERDFEAPRERLWQAFTDPRKLAAWFGPEGWGVDPATARVEPRAGGAMSFVMSSNEDPTMSSPVDAVFVEVREPELLIGRTAAAEQSGGSGMELRVSLRVIGSGRTTVALRQGPYPEDLVEMAREGWQSSFRKLDRLLADEGPAPPQP
jgi:uncharacterized protein YndB with AHSA1/START domain